MCGIVGIVSHAAVAAELYDSLIHLQHRGQNAAGILTDDGALHRWNGPGLVRDVFTPQAMARLTGRIGIGHARYPTHGGASRKEMQPCLVESPHPLGLAYNGNLVNYAALAQRLRAARPAPDGAKSPRLTLKSDTDLLLRLFSAALHAPDGALPEGDEALFERIVAAVEALFEQVVGAYSVVVVIAGRGLVAFRDPRGIRPLIKGERRNDDGSIDHIFASETTMLYARGFRAAGDLRPGEARFVSAAGRVFSRHLRGAPFSPCIFEYVYFARPDSTMNDVNVYRSRLRMGQNLATLWQQRHPDVKPDIVIPVPSTSNTAALAIAHQLGVRYSEGLYKNAFIGRTFIMPGYKERERSVRYKLAPQELEIRDKRVMIVDDSIVRGITSRAISRMVRDFGAKAVYFLSACPPVRWPCFYGVDMPTQNELIANNQSEEEIRAFLEVDILLYQEIDGLLEAVTRKGDHHIDRPCMACLDGDYVTGGVNAKTMHALAARRCRERGAAESGKRRGEGAYNIDPAKSVGRDLLPVCSV